MNVIENCAICHYEKLKLKRFDSNTNVSCYQWVSKVEINNSKNLLLFPKSCKKCRFLIWLRSFMFLCRVLENMFTTSGTRELRSKVSENDCLIQIDYSENYMCRYSQEIQSTHFGGSHKQVTLQTGIYYVGQQEPKSFCTISDSRIHEPIAIWEYLKPFLSELKQNFPTIKTVHFFTDGPVTQYRQKKNFYLLTKLLHDYSLVTWNFWEASHGKGPADGIDAVLKRSADKLVRQGVDIPSGRVV